jgi:hypothetical protein
MIIQLPSTNSETINDAEESTMTSINAFPAIDGLRSAPGAARTASARTQRSSELRISATLAIERRRRSP